MQKITERQLRSPRLDQTVATAEEVATARGDFETLAEHLAYIQQNAQGGSAASLYHRPRVRPVSGTFDVLVGRVYNSGGELQVFRNGILQAIGNLEDYIELDAGTVRFNRAFEEGETVDFILPYSA